MNSLPIPAPSGSSFNPEQANYLHGFVAGLQARGVTFGDVAPLPAAAVVSDDDLIPEERYKRAEHPLDSTYRIYEHARANKLPDKEDTFRFKWNGLFYLSPVKEAMMARLRIPGGHLTTFQLREIARVAEQLTTGYVQITTRANFQLRLIAPKDAPEFLRRIQSIGLHTRGAGADNIRNITANPTAGFDPHELIDVMPLALELGTFIINHREFYDLPRKFNIAFDGGGLIGSVEDTNDLGASAVQIEANDQGLTPGLYFRIKAGGATGHKAFANDLGVLVPPDKINEVLLALLKVYIKLGNRTDRKRARLKHLLEKLSLADYVAEAEKRLGYPLPRLTPHSALRTPHSPIPPHSHIGVYPQKQPGLSYLGVGVPVGNITPQQLLALADLADELGTGIVRLTVWQNLIIPNIPHEKIDAAKQRVEQMGLLWKQSNLSSGFIACTGNRYCKFAASDTKGNALALIKHLEDKFTLDQPINVHVTGCAHSCAQHYMGDIGLLATKTKDGREGYHVLLGGGFGANQALGRQVFTSIAMEEMPELMEKIFAGYQRRRQESETFQSFTTRHELNDLQAIFTNHE
jgi:ferredoxin-nitrite reductase